MEQVRNFLKKAIEVIKRPEMRILPGQLAFFFVVSLIPIIALLGAIASSFSISIDTLRQVLENTLPATVGDVLVSIISGKGLNFNIGVFFISAFILASNGCHSIIIASNQIYQIKSRDIIRRRIKAILMTVILVTLLTFLLLVPVFGDSIFELLKSRITDQNAVKFFYNAFQIAKYPLSLALIYFNIKLIYVIAPDEQIESVTTTKGALFTTIIWIISTEVYSFYVETFTKYDIFYGSISNILVLLLWVYILSYIFVLGLVINAGDYRSKTQELNTNNTNDAK